MEFKKIDDTKFQCLLYEEDLEDNNISLDDFFRNDTAKIHGLLDVVMEEAQKSIGVIMDSGVMSLQLAPQPNHSILLTISSGKDDFGDMLRQAGERAAQAISSMKPQNKDNSLDDNKDESEENDDFSKAAPFSEVKKESQADTSEYSTDKELAAKRIEMPDKAVFIFDSLSDFEDFCIRYPRTWGINNSLYSGEDKQVILITEKGRCSVARYQAFVNEVLEYSELISCDGNRIAYIKEHNDVIIANNSINIIKRVMD